MDNSQVDEIKSRLDILDVIGGYIKLQKAGRNYKAPCPFHNEKSPSFMVSPERQIWHCFGCGEGGDIFSFVMKMDGLEFGDAMRLLADRAGVILRKQDPSIRTVKKQFYEICELSARFFETQLWKSKAGSIMLDYLRGRSMDEATIKEWRIGYAPAGWHNLYEFLKSQNYKDADILQSGMAIKSEKATSDKRLAISHYDRFRDRLMFPVCDINGQVVGFSGRINPKSQDKESAKYINTPQTIIYDKGNILFGLNKGKAEIRKKNACLAVEGNMDVIMCHQAGFKNSVATSGTALTENHLKIIKRYTDNVLFAFDSDTAGDIATKRGIDLAIKNGFDVRVIGLSEKDPADLIKLNIKKWEEAVSSAKEVIDFYFSSTLAKFKARGQALGAKDKKQIAQILLPVVKKSPNKIEQAHWIQALSKEISVDEKILWEELKALDLEDKYISDKIALAGHSGKNKPSALEERLICLLLACPQAVEWQKIEQANFADARFAKLASLLKDGGKVGGELKNIKETLELKMENEDLSPKDAQAEIEFCLQSLRRKTGRDKLAEIQKQIKIAEERGDIEKLGALLKQFNESSGEIL